MLFYLMVILITVLYIALLELSKNIIAGWVVGIVAAVLMMLFKGLVYKKGRGKRLLLFVWCIFIGALALNYSLTQPTFKRVPAVDNKNPDVTDVITIPQGDLTGVYNVDHSVRVFAGIPYAKPPVGELRYKEPQAPDKWEGILKADHFGPMQ